MNIKVQTCGLAIVILLYIFYRSHRTLKLYREKIFKKAMICCMCCLTFDIGSLIAIFYRQELSQVLVKGICKTYIVLLVWSSLFAFVYVFIDIVSAREDRGLVRFYLIGAVESLIVYLLPISIHDASDGVYTYGPSIIVVYVFCMVNIISTLLATFLYAGRINPRRKFAVRLWMCIWLISAGIQFFFSALLLVGFAGALGVTILFVLMENPEANIDRKFECFNSYVLNEYLEKLLVEKEEQSAVEISYRLKIEEWNLDIENVMMKTVQALRQYPSVLVFKNVNMDLILLSKDNAQLEEASEEALRIFKKMTGLEREITPVMIKRIGRFAEADEVFRFFAYIRTEYVKNKGEIFRVTDDMIASYIEYDQIKQEIEDALAQDRVEVFLQPIYSNKADSFTSAEALVRIRQKDGGLLNPGSFIPVAEDTGQILKLGERIFEKVCDFLKTTDVLQRGIHYIEINLSVIQCEKENLAERLISIAKRYGTSPEWINLEITETASISVKKTLMENMKKLIDYGFHFSLDDFGKGESNLMYVVEMPVSLIKLDYDMSKAYFRSEKARHVVKAVIQMAHNMKLRIVAEGIETEEEIEGMKAEEVDYIQGFYYSRPLPMSEFLDFCSRHRKEE